MAKAMKPEVIEASFPPERLPFGKPIVEDIWYLIAVLSGEVPVNRPVRDARSHK
jgi:hypothetical protein